MMTFVAYPKRQILLKSSRLHTMDADKSNECLILYRNQLSKFSFCEEPEAYIFDEINPFDFTLQDYSCKTRVPTARNGNYRSKFINTIKLYNYIRMDY